VPSQDRFRPCYLRHLLQRLAAQPLTDFGQAPALGVAQPKSPLIWFLRRRSSSAKYSFSNWSS
jgi:hypothetical protein